jgi:uncharacterized membrane protein
LRSDALQKALLDAGGLGGTKTPARKVSVFLTAASEWLDRIGLAKWIVLSLSVPLAFFVGVSFIGLVGLVLGIAAPAQIRSELAGHVAARQPNNEMANDVAARQPDIEYLALLGAEPNAEARSLFTGSFEAVGLAPRWAVQSLTGHALVSLPNQGNEVGYEGQREIRMNGMRVVYPIGMHMTLVVVRQRCLLQNGVTTNFRAFISTDNGQLEGCASPRESEAWPPWEGSGSDYWSFAAAPAELPDNPN